MICADFREANLDNDNPTVLLQFMSRFFKFLPVLLATLAKSNPFALPTSFNSCLACGVSCSWNDIR